MSSRSDKDLVHDAWLEVKSDPDNYTEWQRDFIEDIEFKFKNDLIHTLSMKQMFQVRKILEGDDDWNK